MTDETAEAPAAPDYAPEVVEAVRAAEAAAQRSLCTFPEGDVPAALEKALERRVEANLAATGGEPVTRIGSTDATVLELEAPFRKRRSPEIDEAPKSSGSHRRRSTKKKPASKKENS